MPPRMLDQEPDLLRLIPRQQPYRIRLACTPVRFRRHLWAFRHLGLEPISPAADIAEKSLDVAWDEGGFTPRVRYAAFVFDRDDGRLRIVEDGPDLFGPISLHAHGTGINPSSATKGWDYVVQVAWLPLEGKTDTVRQVVVSPDTSKGPTPFTAAEIEVFDDPRCRRDELETRHFVRESPDRIRELWSQVALLDLRCRSRRIRRSWPKGSPPANAYSL